MQMQIDIPFTAATDLRAFQHRVLNIGGTLAIGTPYSHGLLLTRTDSGEDGTIRVLGRGRFIAGGTVLKGERATVTSGGWMVNAASGDNSIGFSETGITSGSVGRGVFNFLTPYYHVTSNTP